MPVWQPSCWDEQVDVKHSVPDTRLWRKDSKQMEAQHQLSTACACNHNVATTPPTSVHKSYYMQYLHHQDLVRIEIALYQHKPSGSSQSQPVTRPAPMEDGTSFSFGNHIREETGLCTNIDTKTALSNDNP